MKCISDDKTYTSNPPQYRCKHCLKWWYCHQEVPECSRNMKTKPETKDQKIEGIQKEIDDLTEKSNRIEIEIRVARAKIKMLADMAEFLTKND